MRGHWCIGFGRNLRWWSPWTGSQRHHLGIGIRYMPCR